jgi:hypothetical protein
VRRPVEVITGSHAQHCRKLESWTLEREEVQGSGYDGCRGVSTSLKTHVWILLVGAADLYTSGTECPSGIGVQKADL